MTNSLSLAADENASMRIVVYQLIYNQTEGTATEHENRSVMTTALPKEPR